MSRQRDFIIYDSICHVENYEKIEIQKENVLPK